MSTGLLEQRVNYPNTGYEYGYGSNGNVDADNDGRKEIDCSNLLNRMLRDAGYNIPYSSTGALATDTTHFDVVLLNDVQPGDIALWTTLGHTGVIEEMDANHTKGKFFGSQTSTGPKSAKYGAGSGYWPMPNKYLRPKAQYRSGAQPAPVPAPAPAPVAPAPASTSPLMNFQYPFRKANGKQFIDAEDVYKALEGETSGHYLLGSNKFWHGGIHITDKSAPQCVLNEPVRCMADGEVVAYRLNQDYLESTFGENEKKLKYSNSFCLVRHEYKSAPNPEEGPNKGKQNKLNFYSLYMHLLPHKRYPLSPQETPKPKVTMKVGDFKVYDEAPLSSDIISPGKAVTGTKFEVLDQKDVNNITYGKGKILSGSVKAGATKVRNVGSEVWFAYLKDGEPYKNTAGARIWVADAIPERARPSYWQGKVKARASKRLPIHGAPANPTNGQPAGAPVDGSLELAVNSVIEFDSKDIVNLVVGNVLRRMASCTLVSGGVWQPAGNAPPTFWTIVENDPASQFVEWQTVTPTDFDSVVSTGTGIKAGDPIGYLGQTENLTGEDGGVTSTYQVHVEIFTAEADVKEFLKNPAGLKIGKQYLHLPAEAGLKKKAPATDVTPLKKEHAVDLNMAPVIKEGNDEYYEVNVIENDQSVTGLVKKSDAKFITQHDWEKLGFQIVEETNATADGFLDPEDMPQFFKDLYAKVDSNGDGNVDPGELANALKNANTRTLWTKLIAHHPTEWKDKAESIKWSKLDKLLETSPKTLKHEKERISKYVFWEDLTGKAAVSSDVIWHFHSVAFVANLLSATCIPLNKAKEIALLVSSGYEGKSKLDYEALAGNFDGQGMSFGIIQWNFGQGTLGPVLLEMRAADQATFDGCFGANMNFQTLLNSLNSTNTTAQMNWAIGVIASNNAGWKSAFKKVGEVEAFKKIQLDNADKYNDNITSCIKLMRELAPSLMVKVQLRTYCALYDLCVQQNNLVKAEQLIRTEFPSANITTQKELVIFVCKKRAEKASTAYRADAFSRRMGIIQGQKYTATMSGNTATRENGNYGMIIEGDICEL